MSPSPNPEKKKTSRILSPVQAAKELTPEDLAPKALSCGLVCPYSDVIDQVREMHQALVGNEELGHRGFVKRLERIEAVIEDMVKEIEQLRLDRAEDWRS